MADHLRPSSASATVASSSDLSISISAFRSLGAASRLAATISSVVGPRAPAPSPGFIRSREG
jgi:hypothetical protein